MDLFVKGDFTLHSGRRSSFKIDCDALSDAEVGVLCELLARRLENRPFSEVRGVPTGGLRIADAMKKYINPQSNSLLIVDDVVTTGRSIKEFAKAQKDWQGQMQYAAIFARKNTQFPVVFQMMCGPATWKIREG